MESDDERESDRDSETDSDKDIPIKDTGSGPDAETQEGCENSRSMFGRTYHGFRDHSRRSDTFGRFKRIEPNLRRTNVVADSCDQHTSGPRTTTRYLV